MCVRHQSFESLAKILICINEMEGYNYSKCNPEGVSQSECECLDWSPAQSMIRCQASLYIHCNDNTVSKLPETLFFLDDLL